MSVLDNENDESLFTGERFLPEIEDDQMHMEHYQRYLSICPLTENKVVVDAACGEGYGSSIIAKNAKKVIGIDIDSVSIQRAKIKYTNPNISFLEGSVTDLPIEDNSVDLFISFETIEHIDADMQEHFLNEISRVLKKDGILIMSSPNKEIYSDLYNYHNEFHKKEFYKDEFILFLKRKFRNVKLYHQFFEIVGVIDSYDEKTESSNYVREADKYSNDGKYLIAIAGNQELPDTNLTSVYMNTRKEYEEKNMRIIRLQKEELERNRHISELDIEINKDRIMIQNLQQEEESRNKHIKLLDAEIEKLQNNQKKLVNKNQMALNKMDVLLNNKTALLNEKDAKLNEKDAQLNEKDVLLNEKDAIINSLNKTINDRDYIINQKDAIIINLTIRKNIIRGVLKLPRKLYERIFPLNTKRRVAVSRFKNKVIHPIQQAKLRKMYRIEKVPDNLKLEEISFQVYEKPLVSIVIPVYNQINYTYNCLNSILKETEGIPYEIIIADDVSTDKTKQIKNFIHGITVVRNSKNLGFLRNCNHAAKAARGKYLFFLNNDTQVLENWLQPLIDLMEKDNTIGLTGSKLIFANGTLQEAGGILWNDASGWNYGRNQDPTSSEFNYVKEVDYISGAAIMIRKTLWDEIGGFDERYIPAYCEDSDLAFEVRKHGYLVVYQPLSQIVHFEGISNGCDVNSGIKKYQVENNEKFKQKWHEELENHFANGENVFRARERNYHKKIILVIDHYVPTFDKDAGSKTTFQYLKMFLKKGYCVKFLGDNFYQSEPYTTILQQMGIEVLYGSWYAGHALEWIRENKDDIHVVYLNRPHITAKYIDFLKRETNIKLIYYGHDLHSLRLKREYELTGDQSKLKESNDWLDKELGIMRKVNMSYYPSCVEEEEIHKIDANIPVKAITAYVYDTFKEKISYDFSKREGILFVGGFGHDPNIDAVLWFVNSIYPIIRNKISAEFYIVGSNPPSQITDINMEGVVVKGYVSEEELAELYSKCKITVVPLRYGAGVKGKVIEAIYNGMPIVTTSCGAEGIPDTQDVFAVADEEHEFADKVIELYNDNKRLEMYANNTQKYIRKYFGTEEVWKVIEKDFE